MSFGGFMKTQKHWSASTGNNMYTLYLDRQEEFICEIQTKNASLKGAFARMIVECGNLALMFPGVLKDGKCQVPIHRLKGLLEENATGKMHLEVVIEDTYFKPWEDNFQVEQHTAVKVKIQEQKKPSKPLVEVKSVKNSKKLSDAASDLLFICERVGINKSNLGRKSSDFKQVVKEYFKANPANLKNSSRVLSEIATALK
jgi:hypothetical protein